MKYNLDYDSETNEFEYRGYKIRLDVYADMYSGSSRAMKDWVVYDSDNKESYFDEIHQACVYIDQLKEYYG